LVLNFVNLFQSNGEIKGIDPMVYGLCTIMGLCNACTNPILYGYLNENFRREYRNLFRKLPWHSIIASNDNQATGNLKSGNLRFTWVIKTCLDLTFNLSIFNISNILFSLHNISLGKCLLLSTFSLISSIFFKYFVFAK
jgi:hypothetical protein